MPPWRKILPAEEEYSSHSRVQGPSQTSTTVPNYPDPSTLGTQAHHPYTGYPHLPPANAMAIEPDNYILHGYAQHNMLQAQPDHQILQYSQSRATSSATNFWGTPGVSPYAASPYAANNVDDSLTLDPSLRGNNFRGGNQSLDCYQQSFHASSFGSQYVGSSSRGINMPAQGAKNITEGSLHYASSLSKNYTPITTTNDVQRAEGSTKGGKRRCLASGSGVADKRSSQTQQCEQEQRRSTRSQKALLAHRAQRPSPREPSSVATVLASSNLRYEEVDGDKYVKIEDEWKLAGHHRDFREKLIMMDAEQPGAPVFAKGTSLDYTGYSPLTRDWTDDPRSIKDSEGQEVMFLPVRPPHLPHNPKCGYLMCEGLVMLDQDNIPIKEYPGAPRTLATSVEKAPGYLLQGLRSILGMTVEDLRARMLVEGDSKSGKRRSHGPTSLTNRTDRWRWDHNLPTWHPRKPRNATKTRASTPSKSSKERKSTSTSGPDLNVEPAQMADGPGSEDIKWDDFDD